MPLSWATVAALVRYRAAMLKSVSPGRTMYAVGASRGGAGFWAEAGTRLLEHFIRQDGARDAGKKGQCEVDAARRLRHERIIERSAVVGGDTAAYGRLFCRTRSARNDARSSTSTISGELLVEPRVARCHP